MGSLFDCKKKDKIEKSIDHLNNKGNSIIGLYQDEMNNNDNKQTTVDINLKEKNLPQNYINYNNIDQEKRYEMKEIKKKNNYQEELNKQYKQKIKELEEEKKKLQIEKNEYQTKKQELDKEKNEYQNKKEKLEKEEKEYKSKKEEFEKECNIYKTNKQNFDKEKKEFDKGKEQFDKDKNEFITVKEKLNKEKEELKNTKDELSLTKINLDKREKEFEQDLEKKFKEKNEQIEINLKAKEDLIIKQTQELSSRENNIINAENSLKEKEQEYSKKNQELIEYQNKFNNEKIFQENIIEQREISLDKYQSSLEKLKISLDKEKENIEKEKKRIENYNIPIEIGLRNIGATCYMNATLQALSNTQKLTEFFLTKYKYEPNNNNKKMSNELYKVLFNLWDDTKKKGEYPPEDFKKALSEENPLFAGVQANDSKDLINFLLERLHKENNNPTKSHNQNPNGFMNTNQLNEMECLQAFLQDFFNTNQSIISDLFYGICRIQNKCTRCNYSKYNFQVYSFLEFPLSQVNLYMFQNGQRFGLVNQDGKNPDINLYECFEYYQKVDLMNGQNQMYCNICNMKLDTYYATNIYSLPNNLIINLNRGKGGVYKCNVNFPETLNLLNYVTFKDGPTAMKLYAVICHFGGNDMSGHFIAFCKHRKTKEWYCYNDAVVTKCTEPRPYNKGMPYILFYQAV